MLSVYLMFKVFHLNSDTESSSCIKQVQTDASFFQSTAFRLAKEELKIRPTYTCRKC